MAAARNRDGFRRANAMLVPSESHGAALRQVYGDLPSLRVVHNATAVPPFDQRKDALILSVGRWWDAGKNGATLDAAAIDAPWPVLLAGPLTGPDRQRAAFRNVQTVGSLAHDAVLALMRRSAIFAAPSRYEPFGLAVVEAAISGAALVLADIPTFRELWDGAALFVGAGRCRGLVVCVRHAGVRSGAAPRFSAGSRLARPGIHACPAKPRICTTCIQDWRRRRK